MSRLQLQVTRCVPSLIITGPFQPEGPGPCFSARAIAANI